MSWIKQALTGPDNETIAIGRLLGTAIAIVLLVGLPLVATVTILNGTTDVAVWRTFLEALGIYVPLIVASIGGLIWGTNFTEPRPDSKGSHQ